MPGRARRQPPALSNNGSASAHGGAGLGRGGMPLGRAGRVCVVFHSDAPLRQRRRRRALHRPRRFAGSPSLAAAGALPRAVGRATLRATRAPAEGDDRARYAAHQTYDGHAHELRKSCARVRARAGAHCCRPADSCDTTTIQGLRRLRFCSSRGAASHSRVRAGAPTMNLTLLPGVVGACGVHGPAPALRPHAGAAFRLVAQQRERQVAALQPALLGGGV